MWMPKLYLLLSPAMVLSARVPSPKVVELVAADASQDIGQAPSPQRWQCARGSNKLGCPLDVPEMKWTLDGIVLVKSTVETIAGISLDVRFYRNLAYHTGVPDEKGVHGFYTFMVVWMSNGASDKDSMPLWVFEHGGGAGYFEEDGTYKGSCSTTCQTQYTYNVEEDLEKLMWQLRRAINGHKEDRVYNSTLDRRLAQGYRLMLVSYSDHDGYAGIGQPYVDNPNGGEVKGLLASWSAVDFTLRHYNTSKYFMHGCSAGSLGVASLATAMALEDYSPRPSGVVADSWMFTNRISEWMQQANRSTGFKQHPLWDLYNATRKLGWFSKLEYQTAAEDYIRAGMPIPVMWVYGEGDPACGGGMQLIRSAITDGIGNCEWNYGLMFRAIKDTPGTPHSIVGIKNGNHVSTIMSGRKMFRAAVDAVEDFIRDKA